MAKLEQKNNEYLLRQENKDAESSHEHISNETTKNEVNVNKMSKDGKKGNAKVVTFEDSSDVNKFIIGEVIVDKVNPFRYNQDDDNNKIRIRKVKKSSIQSIKKHSTTDETDFISKEEILKQSKYVPVYVKNPDKVLTYVADKEVLEKSTKPSSVLRRKIPVPTPRKDSRKDQPNTKPVKKKYNTLDHSKYPNLSDIKVKTGPSKESSVDQNEVVLNAKKFDSLYKKLNFGSTDDIDDISEKTIDKKTNEVDQKSDKSPDDEKKSFTNTINSEDFRSYLKKKGLLLFPLKTTVNNSSTKTVEETTKNKTSHSFNQNSIDNRGSRDDGKKTVFRRLSNIFTKSKTSPKYEEPIRNPLFVTKKEGSLRRITLDDQRTVLATNEFTTQNFTRNNQLNSSNSKKRDDESSISSVLTAAGDNESAFGSPKTEKRSQTFQYRNIDPNRSKLYQTVRQNSNQVPRSNIPNPIQNTLERQSYNGNVVKNRVFQPTLISQTQSPTESPQYAVPFKRTGLRQSLPLTKSDKHSAQERLNVIRNSDNQCFNFERGSLKNQSTNSAAKSSTPTRQSNNFVSPEVSPIYKNHSEIDPFTFAKIHEIKRKTDAVLLDKTSNKQLNGIIDENGLRQKNYTPNIEMSAGNQRFNDLSTKQPLRSQSVLDNMGSYQSSLYGEVCSSPVQRPHQPFDKKLIMQKIYEYYRKSVNNTPVSLQEPIYSRSYHQRDSISSNNPSLQDVQRQFRENSISNYQKNLKDAQRNSLNWTRSQPIYSSERKPAGVRGLKNNDIPVNQMNNNIRNDLNKVRGSQDFQRKIQVRDNKKDNEIYEAVYGYRKQFYPIANQVPVKTVPQRENHYKQINSIAELREPQPVMRTSSVPYAYSSMPRQLPNKLDIIYNNQIYRPISAIPQNYLSLPLHIEEKVDYAETYDSQQLRNIKLMTPESDESELGEVGRIMQNRRNQEEDYQNEKLNRNQQNDQVADDRSRRSSGRREDRERDLRRHTLGSDMLHYSNQGGSLQRSMDLEMGQPQKSRKGIPIRAYTPQHQGPLFDDDPGIMSEVETASTGFRRGGKQRSSLPVVRTPSKTLERPLGLVFLQYRSETKRALLPNEITSIDTVRALFVRSFPRQLSMAYLEGPNVKIYIHDSSKDMFYELEDVRSHLREIRDRSVLRLFESNEVAAAPQLLSGSPGIPQPLPQQSGHWDQDPSYFSEPEFDSEYQHQHIHKSKTGKAAPYYVGTQTLPRGHVYTDRSKNSMNVPAKPMRSYGSRGSLGQFPYPSDQLYSIPDGYMSSPERGSRAYEEPYYTQYGGTRGSSVTPIIDEEQNDASLIEDQYSMYSVKVPNRISRNPNQIYDPSRPEDLHRIRVEHMERQLANLTGLVQKALVQNPVAVSSVPQQPYLSVGPQYRNDKSVSFEKSVSFSDDIQGVPKTHSPQHMGNSMSLKITAV